MRSSGFPFKIICSVPAKRERALHGPRPPLALYIGGAGQLLRIRRSQLSSSYPCVYASESEPGQC